MTKQAQVFSSKDFVFLNIIFNFLPCLSGSNLVAIVYNIKGASCLFDDLIANNFCRIELLASSSSSNASNVQPLGTNASKISAAIPAHPY